MAKTKSRANGDGEVFPRKNKAGKITNYRGAYVGPDGHGEGHDLRALRTDRTPPPEARPGRVKLKP